MGTRRAREPDPAVTESKPALHGRPSASHIARTPETQGVASNDTAAPQASSFKSYDAHKLGYP